MYKAANDATVVYSTHKIATLPCRAMYSMHSMYSVRQIVANVQFR